MKKLISLTALLALVLSGCAYPVGPRESTGTLLGAGTGALIGSQIGSGEGRLVAVALGTLAGALVGQDVGRSLDRADLAYMQQNAQATLETVPSQQSGSWVNPDSGHSGTITPTRTYQTISGQYCREYQQTVVINGAQQQSYGTACRQSDGNWKITSGAPEAQGQVIQQRTVTRVVPSGYYQPVYPYGYYPGYYYPGYLWPLTSISFSYGHFSGHRHHFRGNHRWRGDSFGFRGRFGHR